MELIQRKAKSHKGRKIHSKFEAQQIETDRNVLFLKGTKASQTCQDVMKFFKSLKQNEAIFKQKRNEIHPFENTENLVFLCEKNLSPLFCFGNHSKKKSDHLILGRLYNHQILEMFEFTIQKTSGNIQNALKMINDVQRPIFLCQGSQFELDQDLQRMRNLFHDMFNRRIKQNDLVNLNQNLNFVISLISINASEFLLRFFFMNNGVFEALDYQIDLKLTRKQLQEKTIYDEAINEKKKEIKNQKQKFKKNATKDSLGQIQGRVHIQQQDLKTLKLKKIRKLKDKKGKKVEEKNPDIQLN